MASGWSQWRNFPTNSWWRIPSRLGNIRQRRCVQRSAQCEGVRVMLGKLAGAWIGEKIAGRNDGAKGAILGAGAVAVGKKLVPTLAALALGGWAFKKWREHKRSHPSYPSDAEPRVPPSQTRSPS